MKAKNLKDYIAILNDLNSLLEDYKNSEGTGPVKDALYISQSNIESIIEKLCFFLYKKGDLK